MKDLALTNHMFGVDELDDFVTAFRGALNEELQGHHWYVMVDPDGQGVDRTEDLVVGVAYLAPEPFADRVWNLYFLAVEPHLHGRGAGSQLIRHVEGVLRDAGQDVARVLIVETSSTDEYANARAFYRARGFDEEARIRDFYGPGDNKVVFWKAITV
ncbi:GNAT family N-acetyltransferase [Nocardioides phosphati]|uniref:GNAT family N-acetyltransferase n=1 Tax=Nocardioides phosphati TaxID=1867775 RepID=UPI00166B2AC7|nr:N-acetyltransferase [Nocardioides phosphati]